jgi:hypothetical protein
MGAPGLPSVGGGTVSALGPWEVGDSGDGQGGRDAAVTRGLLAGGHIADWSANWPTWAKYAYYSVPVADEVLAVRVVAELGQPAQDAVIAAFVLGRWTAVEGLIAGFLVERRAQG